MSGGGSPPLWQPSHSFKCVGPLDQSVKSSLVNHKRTIIVTFIASSTKTLPFTFPTHKHQLKNMYCLLSLANSVNFVFFLLLWGWLRVGSIFGDTIFPPSPPGRIRLNICTHYKCIPVKSLSSPGSVDPSSNCFHFYNLALCINIIKM